MSQPLTDREYLRLLIHDKASSAFSDAELDHILADTQNADGSTNVYRAAVFCLNIVLSDPARMQSYSRGSVNWTRADIRRSIEQYRAKAGDSAKTVTVAKVYP